MKSSSKRPLKQQKAKADLDPTDQAQQVAAQSDPIQKIPRNMFHTTTFRYSKFQGPFVQLL